MSAYGSGRYQYYVHYHALTYLRQENKAKNYPFEAYSRAVIKRKSFGNRSGISQQQKEKYLSAINAVMGRKVQDSSVDQKLADQGRALIEQTLLNKYSNTINIDTLSGLVTSREIGILDQGTLNSLKTVEQAKQKGAMSEERVQWFVSEFNNIQGKIANLLQRGTLDKASENRLRECYTKLSNLQPSLAKNFNKELMLLGTQLREQKSSGSTTIDLRFLNLGAERLSQNWLIMKDRHNYLDAFNEALLLYKMLTKANTVAQGDYFEYALTVAADVMNNQALNAVGSTVNKNIVQFSSGDLSSRQVGNLATPASFQLNGMPFEVWEKVFDKKVKSKSTTLNGITTLTKASYSQGKVDTIATFKTDDTIPWIKQIPISAKSYSDVSSLKLVDNTTLWALIQDESPHYLKAYLNTLAKRMDHFQNKDVPLFWGKDIEMRSIRTVINQRKAAVTSAKMLTAYKALTGDMLNRMAVKWFIVNDAVKQKIYLVDISEFFFYILQALQLSGSGIEKFFWFKGMSINELTLDNVWTISPDARMGDIISQAHQQKVEVLFKNTKEVFSNRQITTSV